MAIKTLRDISSTVPSLPQVKDVHPLILLLAALGSLIILKWLISALVSIFKFTLRPGKNLRKYGSWAAITGATDGIGRAYAFELARKGLNILLISRSEDKLKAIAQEIHTKYPHVKTDHIRVDFNNFDESAQRRVRDAFKKVEIGLLVNNVGQSYDFPKYFDELSNEQVHSLLELNIVSTTYMTQAVLPGMVSRRKGAIVNLASAAARNPSPFLALYSGAKSFVELFSQTLDAEYRHRGIHVQVQTPLFVATKLAKIRKTSLTVPSPSAYARAAVAFIGYEDSISPYWSHALELYVMSLLPKSILNTIVFGMHASIRKRALRKLEGSKSS